MIFRLIFLYILFNAFFVFMFTDIAKYVVYPSSDYRDYNFTIGDYLILFLNGLGLFAYFFVTDNDLGGMI